MGEERCNASLESVDSKKRGLEKDISSGVAWRCDIAVLKRLKVDNFKGNSYIQYTYV